MDRSISSFLMTETLRNLTDKRHTNANSKKGGGLVFEIAIAREAVREFASGF